MYEPKDFIFPMGAEISKIVPHSFSGGEVYNYMFLPFDDDSACPVGNVSYAPKARNAWHSHPGKQLIMITGGRGWYQEEGKEARELHAGDYVVVPAGVKHWHGAAKDSWMTQIGLVVGMVPDSSIVCEKVSDEEYDKLP